MEKDQEGTFSALFQIEDVNGKVFSSFLKRMMVIMNNNIDGQRTYVNSLCKINKQREVALRRAKRQRVLTCPAISDNQGLKAL